MGLRLCRYSAAATLLASIVVLAAPSGVAGAARRPQLVVYAAKRPGLNVRLAVRGSRIVSMAAGASLRCADGSRSGGYEVSATRLAVPVGPDGRFRIGESESTEGAGSESFRLLGRIGPDRIVGTYSAWEEEDHLPGTPRCGTRTPRGLPVAFAAHRISG
jgi:hypothetical protein